MTSTKTLKGPKAAKATKAWGIVSPSDGFVEVIDFGNSEKEAWERFAAHGDRCPDGGCHFGEIDCLKYQGYRCIQVQILPLSK